MTLNEIFSLDQSLGNDSSTKMSAVLNLSVSTLITSPQWVFVRIFVTSVMLLYDTCVVSHILCHLCFQGEIRAFRK